jgi:fructose-bisphosphate aldolase class I
MDEKKYEIMKSKPGFIAALDQSGGSSAKTLRLYGIDEDKYSGEEEMFNLIHEMRARVMKSKAFNSSRIIGVILFEQTMNRKIDDKFTSDYLWDKGIVSFLKVDKGLAEEVNGCQMMKDIPGLDDTLEQAKEKGIFGTKMRSVIKKADAVGIRNVVHQQFEIAKTIIAHGLVPIIEPEVDINAPDKVQCEEMLHAEVVRELDLLPEDARVMFKFTIPTIANFYEDLMEDERVVRIVALSGGYKMHDACEKLSKNKGMIASFSRALLESLNVNDTPEEFDSKLDAAIEEIYQASL